MNIVIISRCLVKHYHNNQYSYDFDFSGSYDGKKVKMVRGFMSNKYKMTTGRIVKIGKEYIVHLTLKKLAGGILIGNITRIKDSDEI